MAAKMSKNDEEIGHFEDADVKDAAYPNHTMAGFDTTEDDLPPGYFRSSFFIGTMSVYSTLVRKFKLLMLTLLDI
jgi:hypothetical protein